MKHNLQPFLVSELVKLRPLEQDDFNALYKIASDPQIWEQHQNKDRYTLENFTAFFQESITSKGALIIEDTTSKKSLVVRDLKVLTHLMVLLK